MHAPPRAALYLRISDKKDAAEKIAAQRSQTLAYAAKKGYAVDESMVFVDEAISGLGHKHRAQFEQLLDAVYAGRVDVIVATEEERFARNVQDKADIAQACTSSGAVWDTLRDGEVDPSTDTSEFFAILRAAVGRMETRRDSARAREANRTRRDGGRPTPGRRTFGYLTDGKTTVEEEAEVVRRIFKAFLGGASIRSITRGLEAEGIQPTTGSSWSNGRIRYILGNPRYGGALSHKGEIIPSTHVSAIVKPEEAAAARALLADETRRTTPGPGVRHLMSGIATCGLCGSTMFFMRSYRCRADTSHPSIEKKFLDPRIENEVVSGLLLGGGALSGVDESTAAVPALTASLARLEDEQRQILQERAEGLLTPAVAREGLLRIKSDRETVEASLDDLRERSAVARILLDLRLQLVPGKFSISDAAQVKAEIRGRWQGLDLDTKRTLVRALIDAKVNPGRGPERVVIAHKVATALNDPDES